MKRVVAVNGAQQPLPDQLLDVAQVGRLSDKGGAMHICQSREEVRIVSAEVIEDSLVLCEFQILAHDLDSEDFAIRECRLGSALSEASVL